MQIGITGATGFLGRYIVRRLAAQDHRLRCWHRSNSNRDGLADAEARIEWIPGELAEPDAAAQLVEGCDAVVHSGLWRVGREFRGGEGDVLRFVEVNVLGTLRLIEAARQAGVGRFVFISTCAVHEIILDDHPLDERHPVWPTSHYGAHKAAIEKFIHSYGFGQQYPICALRPTGIYGAAFPADDSKWFGLVQRIVRDEPVECRGGGKEVHAVDVARAVELLLSADGIHGQAYNCYDLYVSQYDVASYVKVKTGSRSTISGAPTCPKHQIVVDKLRALGMQFGGRPLLEQTLDQLIAAAGG